MKFLSFTGGVITGVSVTFLLLFLFSKSNQPTDDLPGLTVFPEKGECIAKKEAAIFQVVKPNMALAETGKFPDQIMILLINYDSNSYYDDQKIKIPQNKCGRQVGIYQYTTKMGIDKTVPAVVIE